MMDEPKSFLDGCSLRRAEIARRLGVDRSALTRWAQGKVPAGRVLDVERVTGVPRQTLRPDLYLASQEAAE